VVAPSLTVEAEPGGTDGEQKQDERQNFQPGRAMQPKLCSPYLELNHGLPLTIKNTSA
jgi:hypothetical protein